MIRLNGWQRLWVVAVLVWGVVVYWQTDWPRRGIHLNHRGQELSAEHLALDAAHAARTRGVVLDRFGYWVLTSLGLYALGHGIAWSRRGFSEDVSHFR